MNFCPNIPINNSDESSFYSTLLMPIRWPLGGENYSSPGNVSDVECLKNLMQNKSAPNYVNCALQGYQNFDIVRHNVGHIN